MAEPAEYVELSNQTGISPTYAHDLLSARRQPSKSLAVHIYRRTGRRFPPIAELSDAEIDLLEKMEPYKPAQERVA